VELYRLRELFFSDEAGPTSESEIARCCRANNKHEKPIKKELSVSWARNAEE
jgi:hypothetical protein